MPKRVLIFVDWYVPGYKGGGPIKSILGLTQALGNRINMDVITRDRDFQSREPYAGISTGTWITQQPGVRIAYLKPGWQAASIKRLTAGTRYDSIYVNSFFSFHYSIKPRLMHVLGTLRAPKFIVAPRAEMMPARLQVKPWKKKPFLLLARLLGMYRSVYWHATAESELHDIKAMWGAKARVFCASNIAPMSDASAGNAPKESGSLKLVFISRIVPYKNPDFVLQILAEIPKEQYTHLSFAIYGPIEDEAYWKSCLRLIGRLNSDKLNISYKGELEGSAVVPALSNYHLFFFPSSGENFGHVIAEALAAAVPVLISNTTPWNGVEAAGAGWAVALSDRQKFKNCLLQALAMDQQQFQAFRLRARQYFEQSNRNEALLESYLKNL